VLQTHTLLFSPITPEYLQDTAHQWKASGYDGFLLANVMRNWSDDVWATDGQSGTCASAFRCGVQRRVPNQILIGMF
jgi:hypothetical protein